MRLRRAYMSGSARYSNYPTAILEGRLVWLNRPTEVGWYRVDHKIGPRIEE
jgi:hypothetical protein